MRQPRPDYLLAKVKAAAEAPFNYEPGVTETFAESLIDNLNDAGLAVLYTGDDPIMWGGSVPTDVPREQTFTVLATSAQGQVLYRLIDATVGTSADISDPPTTDLLAAYPRPVEAVTVAATAKRAGWIAVPGESDPFTLLAAAVDWAQTAAASLIDEEPYGPPAWVSDAERLLDNLRHLDAELKAEGS